MEHCGIDLHGKSSEVAVVDEAGELVETARIPTTEKMFCRWFGGRAGMRICLEAGGMSAWAERILARLGHEVVVCNPARVRRSWWRWSRRSPARRGVLLRGKKPFARCTTAIEA